MTRADLPALARHWLPYALGGERRTHGFVAREPGKGRGFVSLCRRAVLERLADAPPGSAPMCPDCSAEGDRRLAAWRARAGAPSSLERSPYSREHLESEDGDIPDDPDPYA